MSVCARPVTPHAPSQMSRPGCELISVVPPQFIDRDSLHSWEVFGRYSDKSWLYVSTKITCETFYIYNPTCRLNLGLQHTHSLSPLGECHLSVETLILVISNSARITMLTISNSSLSMCSFPDGKFQHRYQRYQPSLPGADRVNNLVLSFGWITDLMKFWPLLSLNT